LISFRSGANFNTLNATASSSSPETSAKPPLYSRLGGHKGISHLLHSFYADVRQHEIIGPIFNRQIHDWPAHILKITEFWARATGGPSMYAGQMPLKHLALGLQADHFQHWLNLWDFNCRRHLKATEAEEMSRLAQGIGARLREIVDSNRILPPASVGD
jgi:hemoglobin